MVSGMTLSFNHLGSSCTAQEGSLKTFKVSTQLVGSEYFFKIRVAEASVSILLLFTSTYEPWRCAC